MDAVNFQAFLRSSLTRLRLVNSNTFHKIDSAIVRTTSKNILDEVFDFFSLEICLRPCAHLEKFSSFSSVVLLSRSYSTICHHRENILSVSLIFLLEEIDSFFDHISKSRISSQRVIDIFFDVLFFELRHIILSLIVEIRPL